MAKQAPKYPDERKLFVYKLVDHRRALVLCIIAISILILPFALTVELDRTLKSAYVTSSTAYGVYKDFVETYGSDEFIVIAIKDDKGARDPDLLKSVARITDKLKEINQFGQVLSLPSLKVVGERKGIFGNYPLVEDKDGVQVLISPEQLERIRKALPIMDYLVSADMKSVGIMFRLEDDWRFHPELGKLFETVEAIVRENLPPNTEFRMVGAPVIREAVQQLTVRTTVLFGSLCALIVAIITLYIFKSLRVAAITMITVGIAVYWVLGLMSLCRIPLNSTTSLSFGLILITSVATVIHIVSHYCEVFPQYQDKELAVKRAMAIVGRACFMAAATSSVAFATIMISDIPMVQQLGFVMALGVLIAYGIGLILTPAFLIWLKPVPEHILEKMKDDWVSRVFEGVERIVFRRYSLCAWGGIIFTLFMFSGAPLIRIDTQILSLFLGSSKVMTDLGFVEKNLHPVRTLEVTVEMGDNDAKTPEAWQKAEELQKRLLDIPEVYSVDSMLPLLQYLHVLLAKPGTPPKDLFSEKGGVSQMFSVMAFSQEGKQLLRRYVSPTFSGMHLSVRIGGTSKASMNEIIYRIEKTSEEVMKGLGKVRVTGEQAVFAAQASDVVDSQVWSLILALSAISVLLMIQLKSVLLGLFSLLPIVPAVATILGMMGWIGIPLDNVTVFATDIAIGLAVDDTFHYLTQLRRDIAASAPGEGRVAEILQKSYHMTARSLMSTTAPLFIGFMALAVTPTKPAIFFGFLGSAAMLVALYGNIVFLPAIILRFKVFTRLLEREAKSKAAAQEVQAQ